MLQQLSKILLIVSLVSLLSACLFGKNGYIHDRQKDYLAITSEPNLKIPGNLQPADMTPALPIPAGNDFNQAPLPSLVPPLDENAMLHKNIQATQQAQQPLSAKLGTGASGFPVLKLASSYNVSWIKMKTALNKLNYQIIGSDPKTGIYEVMAAKTPGSEIYQIKIAAGTSGTLISVLDQTGSDVPANTSKKILNQLQTQLSK